MLGMGVVLITLALGVGISDNPPGIGLTYLGCSFLCYSMIHQWRTSRDFGTMLAVAVISVPVLVLIHNIFDTLNDKIGVIPVFNQLFEGIAVIAFIGGVIVTPAVALVGILGGVFYLVKKHLT